VDFDLMCFWFGPIAYQKAAAAGEEATDDYYIGNVNPKIRTVPVDPGAVAYRIDNSGGPIAQVSMPYDQWRTTPALWMDCPGPGCIVWLYVNQGRVTELVEQYTP